MKSKLDKYTLKTMSNRRLSVVVFSLFFSWLLAFPFEGRILYALTDNYNISADSFVFGTMIAHFAGLLTCSFFVKNLRRAKRLILFSIVFCIVASSIFFRPPFILWMMALLTASFLVGCCVAAWGFYFKHYTPKDERIKTIADGLICSNLLMILINMVAIHISPHAGLGFSMLILGIAFLFALRLPKDEESENPPSAGQEEIHAGKAGPLVFLCLFIVVITINSGLMYQVQGPAFAHLEWLSSWYWALPYIVAIFIMRNLPRKTNRAYILYVAIAMIGFSFIAFFLLGRSWVDYLIVNTLILGACGVYDLFWWSILGEMLELHENPAKIMGIGLSANILGVLLGGLIGIMISPAGQQNQNSSMLALGVVCITLVLLPPLHKRLITLLKNHVYLTAITEIPTQEQDRLIGEFNIKEKLTEREVEIAALIIKGKTYRMIAGELHVSENTVKTHVKNIYSKAEVQSRAELMHLLLDIRFSH
ncbi:LuxR C-terminal-related transcriptional regulator [Serpentinicella sp. ANB-PHB4]|uniref:LuxR C-terminal-related transcriptional regulator n=1 Tax=Serpentinicella sp. ANB-PHB4 TaxID=3074076 RepID=UPI00285A332B|nr:LuxR C-terminal-related transcriptional regulator [Serpentinicella sp. ANB-PHB4]MDR5658372.1 LuxR C-terminal-related transcriptional regulator [Serpentinicella sp. ANB-PHB4]